MRNLNIYGLGAPLNIDRESSSKPHEQDAKLVMIDALLKSAQDVNDTLDQSIVFATPMGATDALMAASLHQKQIVAQMMGSNPEDAIALALAASIEAYGKQLETLQGWTNGGLPMFESMLSVMFEAAKESGLTSGYILEDLFQLAIIDFVSHGYGNDPNIENDMMEFLESTGSGSHGYHGEWAGGGPKWEAECERIYNYMYDNSPEGSLCHEILSYMNNSCGGVEELKSQYLNSYENEGGFVGDPNYPATAGLSPMLRLALIAAYLDLYPEVDQETINMFLTAPIGELDAFIQSTTDYESAIEFMCENDGYEDPYGWRLIPQHGHMVIDWFGYGLDADYFEALYSEFPPRELTEAEIEEVNRIGDQVKMLQQTLKYWLQICRDEQMSIARNI